MSDLPLTPSDVASIHADLCDEYPETTESMNNPNIGFISQAIAPRVMEIERPVFERAAALLRFLVETHPFPDGNKRTAYNATALYLALHGHHLEGDDSIRTMVKLLGTDSELPDFLVEEYLKNHCTDTLPDDFPSLDNCTPDEKNAYAAAYREQYREIFDALATE